ncbi:MAG: molybdate ABC transporter substrate-binding protein [Candidatus Latescibacteria bacterium]|nr:molybdate ABC transporter substrate-binding protein [Candidatus Latescibacterota bacterium]
MRLVRFFIYGILSLTLPLPAAAQTLYAAASLTSVLQELAPQYDGPLQLSFASSSTLARQIEAGAPADLYFSANQDWMDYLQKKGLLETASRIDLVGNKLVFIAPRGEGFNLPVDRPFSLAAAFSGRLALADPDHVPAGLYARQALMALGWWEALKNRLAPAPHVRAALVYVERGACTLGLVYATDAAISKKIETLTALPDSLHDPIHYPIAVLNGRMRPAVGDLLNFLQSPVATDAFQHHGFTVLTASKSHADP